MLKPSCNDVQLVFTLNLVILGVHSLSPPPSTEQQICDMPPYILIYDLHSLGRTRFGFLGFLEIKKLQRMSYCGMGGLQRIMIGLRHHGKKFTLKAVPLKKKKKNSGKKNCGMGKLTTWASQFSTFGCSALICDG